MRGTGMLLKPAYAWRENNKSVLRGQEETETKRTKDLNHTGLSSSLWHLCYSLHIAFSLLSPKTSFLPFSTPQGGRYGGKELIAS